jgi:hypothetical protein
VSCYVERRQPPDVFPDDLNCILNFCDCSVAVVGGERLPSSSINSVLTSLASSHLLPPLVAYSLHFPSIPPWARARKVGVPHTIPAISGNVSRLLPRRTSETQSTRRRSSPPSQRARRSLPLPWRLLMIQTTPRGLPQRYGPTSGSSSVPGSRARMSRGAPRTRRTPRTHPRRAAVTAMARTMATAEAAAMAMATAAKVAARVAVATAGMPARAAARAATRPVVRRHWF